MSMTAIGYYRSRPRPTKNSKWQIWF